MLLDCFLGLFLFYILQTVFSISKQTVNPEMAAGLVQFHQRLWERATSYFIPLPKDLYTEKTHNIIRLLNLGNKGNQGVTMS